MIDPILRELDWDTANPTQVIPEYRIGALKADYALFGSEPDIPSVLVEAKSLGKPLAQGIEQAITYCVSAGVEYFMATDGLKWAVYETFKKVLLKDKILIEINLSTDAYNKSLMDLL